MTAKGCTVHCEIRYTEHRGSQGLVSGHINGMVQHNTGINILINMELHGENQHSSSCSTNVGLAENCHLSIQVRWMERQMEGNSSLPFLTFEEARKRKPRVVRLS